MTDAPKLPARWDSLPWPDFARLDPERTVAMLPAGSIEQHGPHLPVAVDRAINDGMCAAVMARAKPGLPLLLLPTSAYGKSDEHLHYPGTLTLSGPTLLQVWYEIGASVARAGVRKLLILNSHGGQTAVMQIVARRLRIEHDMLVVAASWSQMGVPDGLFPPEERQFGIHAGDVETSVMLALHPELVDMAKAQHFVPATQRRANAAPIMTSLGAAGFGWMAQDLDAGGAAGNAAIATVEKGQAVIDHVAPRILDLVREISALPLSDLADGPLARP